MSNSLLRVHEITFGKIVFFSEKILFFENLLTLTKKLSVVLEQSFSRVIKTAFYVSRWSLREKRFRNLLLSFIFFIHGQKNLNFRWKLFHSPSKLYLTCRRQQLEKKYVSRLNRNSTLVGVSVKIFPRGSSKLHFICSQPNFEHLLFFDENFVFKNSSDFGRKTFRLWEKSSGGLTEMPAWYAKEAFSLTNFFSKGMFLFVTSLGVCA